MTDGQSIRSEFDAVRYVPHEQAVYEHRRHELLREDLKRGIEERLEALLLEGLNSGKPIAVTPEHWEKKRQQLIERHNAKNKVRR